MRSYLVWVVLWAYVAFAEDLRAPDSFSVLFTTTVNGGSNFTIEVQREWAPNGVDHFYTLLQPGTYYYDNNGFFRVLAGFVVQWGINGNPSVTAEWDVPILDDPVIKSNLHGWMAYAMDLNSTNTRTTQVYINYGNNSHLDASGFAPFARVTSGMDIVESIYAGYGQDPSQSLITTEGNEYLRANFPQLDYILSARIIEAPEIYTRDNCVYRMNDQEEEELIECIYMMPYSCENYWIFDVGMYDEQIDTQIIKFPSVVSNSVSEMEKCFDDQKLGVICTQCFQFYNISHLGERVEAQLHFNYSCDSSFFQPFEIFFENIVGLGPVCGDEGYYYPSCNFTLPTITSKSNTLASDNSPIYLNQDTNSLDYGCVMSQPPPGTTDEEDFPLFCPLISMDTCATQGKISTYQGYQFEMEITKTTTETESCIEDRMGLERLCLRVLNITMNDKSITCDMELNSYMGDLSIASLQMGHYENWFPSCGTSEAECHTKPPISLPNSYSNVNVTQDSDNQTEGSPWLGIGDIILISSVVACVLFILLVILLIVLVVIRRKQNYSIPGPLQFDE